MASTAPKEDLITESIGIFKQWQFWLCVPMFVAKFPVSMVQISNVFLTPKQRFNCSDPDLGACWANCSERVYDDSVFTRTIVSQWDLVCDKEFLQSLSQSLTMLGILTGNYVFGFCADKWGRRRPLQVAGALQVASGVGACFAPWFELFIVLRFIFAAATGGTMVITFVFIMECIGKKWRTVLGIVYQVPFILGHLLLAPTSYFLRDWRYYHLVIALIPSLSLVMFLFLPESPRWLLAVNKTEKAVATMENAARRNKLPVEVVKKNVETFVAEKEAKLRGVKTGSLLDLMRSSIMRKYALCIWYNWFVCGFCYYGLTQFISRLSGDIFLNVAISAAICLPGTLSVVYTTKAWGRRLSLVASNCCTGIPLFILMFIKTAPIWVHPLLACIGISGVMASFSIVYIYSGELFPTVVRNVGVGTSSMSGRIGAIITPFVATLDSIAFWIPPLIYAVIAIIGAILCFFLPETLDCTLPDTIEEAEEFEKTRKRRRRDE